MTTTTPEPITVTVDGTPYEARHMGDMMGAEVWQIEAPGTAAHGTSLMFLPEQDTTTRQAAMVQRVRLAAIPARNRIDLAREFAKVDAAATLSA
jgi:hypothetical protein